MLHIKPITLEFKGQETFSDIICCEKCITLTNNQVPFSQTYLYLSRLVPVGDEDLFA
jgi:hypothetical protein